MEDGVVSAQALDGVEALNTVGGVGADGTFQGEFFTSYCDEVWFRVRGGRLTFGNDSLPPVWEYVVAPVLAHECSSAQLPEWHVPQYETYYTWEPGTAFEMVAEDGLSVSVPDFGIWSPIVDGDPTFAILSVPSEKWPYDVVPGTDERVLAVWAIGNPGMEAEAEEWPFVVTLPGYFGAQDGEVFRLRRQRFEDGRSDVVHEGLIGSGGAEGPGLTVELSSLDWLIATAV